MAADELNGFLALIGNADGVVEEPVALEGLRLFGRILRLDFHADVIRDRF